jgi:hypothetical protein
MSKTLFGIKEEVIQVSFPDGSAIVNGTVVSVTKRLFEVISIGS